MKEDSPQDANLLGPDQLLKFLFFLRKMLCYHSLTYSVRIGGVAGGRVVQGRTNGERDSVAGILDKIDNVAMVQSRYVVVIDGQNAVADVQLRATLRRAVWDDLSDERDTFSHRGDDNEAESFVFATNDRHVVRVNHAATVSDAARIPCIWVRQNKTIVT